MNPQDLRAKHKLNQRELGQMLGIHQATVSRLERGVERGAPIAAELARKLSELDQHLERRPEVNATNATLAQFAGNTMQRLAPGFTEILVRHLTRGSIRVAIDSDPEEPATSEAAVRAGQAGALAVAIYTTTQAHLRSGNYADIPVLSTAALREEAATEAIRKVHLKILLNCSIANQKLGNFEEAKNQLEDVRGDAASNDRLLGLAENELAMLALEQDVLQIQDWNDDAAILFAETRKQLRLAADLLPGKRYPALGMLTLADKSMSLKRRTDAQDIADEASAYLEQVPAEDLKDLNEEERRARWPHLSRARNFFARRGPGVTKMLACLALASTMGASAVASSSLDLLKDEHAGTRMEMPSLGL